MIQRQKDALDICDKYLANESLPTHTQLVAALRMAREALEHSEPISQYTEPKKRHAEAKSAADALLGPYEARS